MPRTKQAIQKATIAYLSRLDGYEGIVSIIKLAPDKILIAANNELTVGEVYGLMAFLGERLFGCPAKTTWETLDKSGILSDFTPVLKKSKRKKK